MDIKHIMPSALRRMQRDLDQLRLQRQHRRLESICGLNLSSNDYLGLSTDPRLKLAVARALDEDVPVCSTGSRLLSGNSQEWEELEAVLAGFIGTEAALYFSSGYLANIGLLAGVLRPDSIVFSDSANHASIIDGIRLSRARKVIFPHLDMAALEHGLASATDAAERFIVMESIFSMDGDLAPLDDVFCLADRYDAAVIIDEAHATGVMGPGGAGLVAAKGRPGCVIATVHTCGKALASMGAFVACSRTLQQYLVNHARSFIFSTALAPYVTRQTVQAVRIARCADDLRSHLGALSDRFRKQLETLGFETRNSQSQILPVVLGSNDRALRVAQELSAHGFGVKAIRPPTVPAGTARLRLSLTARMTEDQIEALANELQNACDTVTRFSAIRNAG